MVTMGPKACRRPATIDAEVHDAVMALPPDERRDREKANATAREGLRLGPRRPAAVRTVLRRRRSSAPPVPLPRRPIAGLDQGQESDAPVDREVKEVFA